MAKYRVGTFKYTPLSRTPQVVSCHAAIQQTRATSFFISCVKRLWDAVGYFLGSSPSKRKARWAGLFGVIYVPGILVTAKSTKC